MTSTTGNVRRNWQRRAGALALAFAASTTLAQTAGVPERVVNRPDGTVVTPAVDQQETRGSGGGWWQQENSAQSDDRERRRLDVQRSADQRLEQSAREREAALQNPARQVAPTVGR
jgi:hypothetical protein